MLGWSVVVLSIGLCWLARKYRLLAYRVGALEAESAAHRRATGDLFTGLTLFKEDVRGRDGRAIRIDYPTGGEWF